MALPQLVMKAPSRIHPFDDPKIVYPQFASIKYDGFRLLNLCGESFLSPALKPFPNVNLHLKFKDFWTYCQAQRIVTDGEIWSPDLTFQQLQSVMRSRFAEIPDSVGYYVFDMLPEDVWNNIDPCNPYLLRYATYQNRIKDYYPGITPVLQMPVTCADQAQVLFENAIADGHEGLILRNPNFGYKHNRCTANENGMWKFKQFETHDAIIIRVNQMKGLREDVVRTLDPISALTARIYTQDSFQPVEAVGSFTVLYHGQEVSISPGRGFTHQDRQQWWLDYQKDPTTLRGKWIEFTFMPHGTMDRPRHGSLVRFRPDKDGPSIMLGVVS